MVYLDNFFCKNYGRYDLVVAFVPGRWIAENGMLAREILHTMKKKTGGEGIVGIKIDMNKAYDRIEWSFVLEILKCCGFGESFVKLIEVCLSTSEYEILLNGSPLQRCKPSRGLRQGDPISPFLFIMAAEALSRL